MFDLHSHTVASDGELSLRELVEMAERAQLRALAVTDHDTVCDFDGVPSASVELISGIEVTCHLNGREIHILGHFVDPTHVPLREHGARLKHERSERMNAMIAKLNALGVAVTRDEVETLAAGAQLGRPHLARALVNRGICSSPQEVFQRFLGDGRPATVAHFEYPASDAIAMLHAAGGTATLAHPGPSRVNDYELKLLIDAGLDGIEAYHPDHVPSLQEKFRTQARTLNLVATGGSDFHGPKMTQGRELGSVMHEAELLALRQRARSRTK
jgi:3',5'-nucleoside bisphosphate phosphatase